MSGATTDHDAAPSPVGAAAAQEEDREGGAPRRIWQPAGGPGPGVVSADALAGRTVESVDGEALGRVVTLTIDLACGRLAYAVVELTPVAGGRLCAVPWPAFRLEPPGGRLVLAFSPDDLRQAPTFAPERWPDMTDERWAEEMHGFFGCRPYWV